QLYFEDPEVQDDEPVTPSVSDNRRGLNNVSLTCLSADQDSEQYTPRVNTKAFAIIDNIKRYKRRL
ncbi:hypothetical protein PTT_06772, partial [Pyrenophora teres f. teres 0-1]